MDLRRYYNDVRAKEAELERDHPEGVVYVTSLFYRERNSTPGCTASATCHNAARVITDGTHRLSEDEEIDEFHAKQARELEKNLKAEQQKNQQYVVVTSDPKNQYAPAPAAVIPGQGRSRGRSNTAVVERDESQQES